MTTWPVQIYPVPSTKVKLITCFHDFRIYILIFLRNFLFYCCFSTKWKFSIVIRNADITFYYNPNLGALLNITSGPEVL